VGPGFAQALAADPGEPLAFVRILWHLESWLVGRRLSPAAENNDELREDSMPNSGFVARRGAAGFAALVSFVLLAVPLERALADKPSTPVTVVNPTTSPVPATVVNPSTSPVPTAVVNPSTNPALTSSVDDPGRIAYQSASMGSCGGANQCSIGSPALPTGHRLVIQHVSAAFGFTAPVNFVVVHVLELTLQM
jgi:hypothetical protein